MVLRLFTCFYWYKEVLKFIIAYSHYSISLNLFFTISLYLADPQKTIRIANPISGDYEYMRPSLIPSILNVVAKNERNFDYIKIYELANIYLPSDRELPEEEKRLILAVSGIDDENIIYPTGKTFYIAKGAAEIIFAELGIEEDYKTANVSGFHPGRTAEIKVGEKTIGVIGEIHPDLANAFGLRRPVAVMDIDFEMALKLSDLVKSYSAISKFPIVHRDLSFVIDQKILYEEIVASLLKTSPILAKVELLDVYTGLEEEGRISKTIRLSYQPTEKTLTEEEINQMVKKAMDSLTYKFKAVVRA